MATPKRPRRRYTDRLTPRDLVYLLALLLIAASGVLAYRADRNASHAIRQVQEGRATSITITCAVLSSISEAGKAVIAGPPKPPAAARERALEALGFPPFKRRHLAQVTAGELYVQGISARIDQGLRRIAKAPVHGLVRKDGTIDCKLLQQVGLVPNPR